MRCRGDDYDHNVRYDGHFSIWTGLVRTGCDLSVQKSILFPRIRL